ncbi:unnamed protein product [Linum trigynum]|uniref:Uncharacterized protein n=1 Tax=Linum trigynum TaxID=586398 RepID=A0AAV2CHU5_9ROSI
MAQNLYCLGVEIHAELSEDRDGEEEDETIWSVSSDHDDREEEEDGEGEQPNYPPYYYLDGNEEDGELSYAGSYGVIPMPIVVGFEGEFYKGLIFHSKQAAQVAIKYRALQRNFQYGVVKSSPSIWKVRCLKHG